MRWSPRSRPRSLPEPAPEPVAPEQEITFHPSEPIPDAAPAAAEPPTAAAPHEPVPDNVTVMWDSLADINAIDRERGLFGVEDAEAAPVAGGDPATVDRLVAALLEAAAIADEPGRALAGIGAESRQPAQAARRRPARHGRGARPRQGADGRRDDRPRSSRATIRSSSPARPIRRWRSLLMPPQPGFLEADKAVEDAYLDLQSHQVATLRAIPGALRATLDRFSPGSIRRRAENIGLLARILPGARDAALWRNYEREFVAVKKESDEAFMEVFSKEFRKAYERQLRDGLN